MSLPALLMGSVGVLAEISELQRRAFNTAFEEHDLFWHWDDAAYRKLLEVPGCKPRIRYYAMAQGIDVDVDAIHASKMCAMKSVLDQGIPLRDGVKELIRLARDKGVAVAVATSAPAQLVDLVFHGLRGQLGRDDFDVIADASFLDEAQSPSEIYDIALTQLGADAARSIAMEDMPEQCEAALEAGLETYAYPGLISMGRRFPDGVHVIERPDARHLPTVFSAA